jgi:hypothetical protein
MERGIEIALQEPNFAFVEILSTCPTQYGHANRQSLDQDAVSLAAAMIAWQEDNCISRRRAEKEDVTARIIMGEWREGEET